MEQVMAEQGEQALEARREANRLVLELQEAVRKIASLETELQEARQALGRELLDKANRQAATFLSSLTGGITDPSSPRN